MFYKDPHSYCICVTTFFVVAVQYLRLSFITVDDVETLLTAESIHCTAVPVACTRAVFE